jgi:branched-chain amino acid transport system ATP-binding protein
VPALREVSLVAGAGELISIIGSNGAGKTTLLRAVSGLVRPRSGEILFEGKRLEQLSTSAVVGAGISHVPEGRELFPRMTVADNLMVGAWLRKNGSTVRRELEAVYHYFPVLKQKSRTLASSLSGGEQQMLAFGRAMMSGPKMLLLDEPSIGLAPLIEHSLMEIVVRLVSDEKIGVLLVEQNAALALSAAKRAYVMELGRITLEGTAEDLMHDDKVKKAYLGL